MPYHMAFTVELYHLPAALGILRPMPRPMRHVHIAVWHLMRLRIEEADASILLGNKPHRLCLAVSVKANKPTTISASGNIAIARRVATIKRFRPHRNLIFTPYDLSVVKLQKFAVLCSEPIRVRN